MTLKVALIAGVGGVLGTALGREFSAAGYAAVGLRRERTDCSTDATIRVVNCDLQSATETRHAVERVVAEFGAIDVLVCNAAHLVVAPFSELTMDDFEGTWRASMRVAVGCAQAALPSMLQRKRGTMIFSGATASIRGAPRFAAFAASKFALRGLAQSLAREYQPQGIHVVHVVLDGLLRGSSSVTRFAGSDEKAIDPAEVARTYRWLAEQHASAWTHEMDLRPSGERF